MWLVDLGMTAKVRPCLIQPGAFQLQQIQPVPLPRLERKLGVLTNDEFRGIGSQLIKVLNLPV